MTCGACVGRVERALGGVPGAREPVVNLLAESASVSLENGATDQALIEAVRSAGYDAEIVAGGRQLLDRIAADSDSRETIRRHRQGMIQVIGLALPIMVLDHAMHVLWGHSFEKQATARYMQMILLVMMGVSPGAAPILVGGLRSALKGVGNMDLLVTLGVIAALMSSIWGVFVARDASFIHLDAAGMILAFVCIGRYLEARAKARAAGAMSALAKHAPRDALVRRGGDFVSTPVERIAVGDEIVVPALEPAPVDGEIIEGEAAIDESLMTGEPMPIRRQPGDRVLGGSIVVEGRIVIRATTTGARSTMGRIVELVRRSQASRTESQRVADRVAAVFVPIVLLVALGAFAGWLLLGGSDRASDAARAAAAVLVVACPCALGLATPTVVTVATGRAALRGILVRDAAALETAGRLDVVIWDKTGTLTIGRPVVTAILPLGDQNEDRLLQFAAAAERYSSHPLAKAIVAEARRRGLTLPEADALQVVPGEGVTAEIDGRRIAVGKNAIAARVGAFESDADRASGSALLPMLDAEIAKQAGSISGGATFVGVWIDGKSAGAFLLRDAVRPSAREAIERLARLGVRSEMLTGDSHLAAMAIAQEIGLSDGAVTSDVTPEGKERRIRDVCAGQGGVRVAMVGDGVNDASALAAADVGIAFAAGAQTACDAADIQLIGSTPMLVADAIELARAAGRIIRQNLFWAFFYNVLMIPLAATGRLSPMWAAAAMMLSSLTVVLNALRLQREVAATR